MVTQKAISLYNKTYQSMLDRTHEDGYADTSITGHYNGMFCRDTSIQIMCHVAHGDYDQARKLMNYIIGYHETHGYDFAIHVIFENDAPPSLRKQADTAFFFIHAWVMYMNAAPQSAEKDAFLASSYSMIQKFANYYLDAGNLDNPYEMLFNDCLEHSRDGSYFYCYDLLTNVYASQGLHELAAFVADCDPENAQKWEAAATKIVGGVHKFLTAEVDGKKIYCELIGRSYNAVHANPNASTRYIRGFSWVNLAPMGCDWYGADPEILENTYQMYLKYGACDYYNTNYMLDVCTQFETDLAPITRGGHVIGKGLAWEMLYCKKMGYTERLAELTKFVEDFSEDMYRETWHYVGGGSDTANQEHASWMLYTHKTIYPELGQ